jgi:hypothetical protein
LQPQLEVYNDAEGDLEKKVKEWLATEANLEKLRYNKATLEIELLTAKGKRSKTHPGPTPCALCLKK